MEYEYRCVVTRMWSVWDVLSIYVMNDDKNHAVSLLPSLVKAPINVITFGCGFLLTSFKMKSSIKRSERSAAEGESKK